MIPGVFRPGTTSPRRPALRQAGTRPGRPRRSPGPPTARLRQEHPRRSDPAEPPFALILGDHERLRGGVEPANLPVDDGAVDPMDAGFVALDFAWRLAVPPADPQPFQPQVAPFVGQRQAAQDLGLAAADLQVGQRLAVGRGDQHPALFLIEIGQEMDAPGPRDDLAHRGDVGLLFGLALDDQVAFPHLEPEGPGDRPVIVADAHRQDEVGLVLPGELEFDHRPGGEPEVAADRGPVLVGPRLPLLLTPRLAAEASRQPARPFGPR